MKAKMKDIKKAVLPSILAAETFFVFGAYEMWFSNQSEFWFSITDILLPCLLGALVGTGLLLGLALLTQRVWKKAFPVLLSLILSLGLALYIQGNFLVADYGVLNGQAIQWENYRVYGLLDTLAWLLCFALPLLLLKFKPRWFDGVVRAVPLFIMGIQLITLGTLFLTNDISKEESAVFTTDNEFDLSKNKNVIVFIVDWTDAQFIPELTEQFPEIKESLKDFVFFDDTLGAYPSTKGGVPFILTGVPYFNEELYNDHITKAVKDGPIFQCAKTNGFKVDAYTSKEFAVPAIGDSITNLQVVEKKIGDMPGFFKTYFKLIAFRYAPHYAKSLFWMYSGDFDKYLEVDNEVEVYDFDNIKFYNALNNSIVTAQREEPVLKFYHIRGMHPPFYTDEYLNEVDSSETSAVLQGRGAFRIIEEFLERLKGLDLYDQTPIVIMADHGSVSTLSQCPSLFIKEPYASYDTMQINSAPVSYLSDWANTLTTYISGEKTGETVFDIAEDTTRTRYYYLYSWDNAWDAAYLPDLYEYQTTGKAADLNKEENFTGNVYAKRDQTEHFFSYHLGEDCKISNLDFVENSVSGVSTANADDGHLIAWLNSETNIRLSLETVPEKDLLLTLQVYNVNGREQPVELIVNGTSAGEQSFFLGEQKKQYIIPKELIAEKELLLTFNSPAAFPYTATPNPVSIAIDGLKLEETDLETISEPEYPTINSATTVVFDQDDYDYSGTVAVRGVYPPGNAAWTSDKFSFLFHTETESDIRFTMPFSTFTQELEGRISFNGHEVGQITKDSSPAEVTLPKEYLKPGGPQKVEVEILNAVSPAEYGHGANEKDTRILGVLLSKVSFAFTDCQFHVGDPYTFDDPDLCASVSGVVYSTATETDGSTIAWLGPEAEIDLVLDEQPESALELVLPVYTVNGWEQRLEVEVNGVSLGEQTVTLGEQEKIFTVPEEALDGKKLHVRLLSPDAARYSYFIKPSDVSVALTGISLKKAGETEVNRPTVSGPAGYTFSNENYDYNGAIAVRGVYPPGKGAWSCEKIRFLFNTDRRSDMVFTMRYGSLQETLSAQVTLNGRDLETLTQPSGTVSFTLPGEYLNENGEQSLEIQVLNADSPANYGHGTNAGDERVLGLLLYEISLDYWDYPYTLGETCGFDDEVFRGKASAGLVYSAATETDGSTIAWLGPEAEINLVLDKQPESALELVLPVYTVNGWEQRLEAEVNGVSLGEQTVTLGEQEKVFTVPEEALDGRALRIRLLSPDAARYSYFIKPSDVSVALTGISLKKAGETEVNRPTVSGPAGYTFIGENYDYNGAIAVRGAYPPGKGAWSSEKMQFLFETEQEETFTFSLVYGSYYEKLNAVLRWNGHELERITEPNGTLSLTLPREYLRAEGPQCVEIQVLNADSPAHYGHGTNAGDERVLGLLLFRVDIAPGGEDPA